MSPAVSSEVCQQQLARHSLPQEPHEAGRDSVQQPYLSIQDEAELFGLAVCSSQYLLLHPLPHLREPAQQLLQLGRPKPEEAAALMQPVAQEPAEQQHAC